MSGARTVIVWEPGTSMSTNDVCAGLTAGLEAQGIQVETYHTGVHLELADARLKALRRLAGVHGADTPEPTYADRIYAAAKDLLVDACRWRRMSGATWVFVVSGMYQHPDVIHFLGDCGFRVALLLTESPYDTEHELRIARFADVVFTCERSVIDTLRQVNPRSYYLPHAWHPDRHVPSVSVPDDTPAHDVVFVGTYFDERVQFLAEIDWTGIDLGLYGGTMDIDGRTRAGRRLRPFVRGPFTSNAMTTALYRRATVGLNLHRTSKGYRTGQYVTTAESLNPRDYELAATGCYFVTDPRAELADVLPMVETFTTPRECEALIRRALADSEHRARLAEQAQAAAQPHTWTARVAQMLQDIRAAEARAA